MRFVATHDTKKLTEHRLREQGYSDGYAGKVARSPLAVYQRSWRLGREARARQDGGNDAA